MTLDTAIENAELLIEVNPDHEPSLRSIHTALKDAKAIIDGYSSAFDDQHKEINRLAAALQDAKAMLENAGGQLVAILDITDYGQKPLKLTPKQVKLICDRAEQIGVTIAQAAKQPAD